MTCCGVPDLMPQNARHFGFIIGQGDQLAGDVDIAAGQRESVVHRRIEQCHVEIALRVSKSRLHGNILTNAHNIGRLRTLHRSAKFFENFCMIFGALIPFLGGEGFGDRWACCSRLCVGGNMAADDAQSQNCGTGKKTHFRKTHQYPPQIQATQLGTRPFNASHHNGHKGVYTRKSSGPHGQEFCAPLLQ